MNSQPSSRLVPCAVCGESFDPKAGGLRLLVDNRRMPICGICSHTTSTNSLLQAIAEFARFGEVH